MKKQHLLVFIFFIPCLLFSQFNISGRLTDTAKIGIFKSSVVYLADTNQVLKKFVRANVTGNFKFENVAAGNYFITAIKENFSDLQMLIKVDMDIELGDLNLFSMNEILKTIYIKAKRDAIRMKGDTLEYAADSFKTFDGAMVEDLLKRLPGMQVDKDGKITAQGKKVERILVDGEEFFGSDGQLATTNLEAKNVDAVQVYQAQTDEAKASNSGETVQVLDIKLKDEAKRGLIGKISAGAGGGKALDPIVEGKALFSKFAPTSKAGLVLLGGNSPYTRLNWDERNTFSNNINSFNSEEGGYYQQNDDDFSYNRGYSQGLPELYSMAGFVNKKLNKNKINLNAAVSYKEQVMLTNNTTNRRQIINNTFLDQFNGDTNINKRNATKLELKSEINIDSFNVLELGFEAENKKGNKKATSINNTINKEQVEINNLKSLGFAKNETLNTSMFAAYRLKFKKPKQFLNVNLKWNNLNSESTDDVKNNIGILKAGTLAMTNFEVNKLTNNKSSRLTSAIIYYHPITKKTQLVFKSNLNFNKTKGTNLTYIDKSIKFSDSFSSKVNFSTLTNAQNLGVSYTAKKYNFELGATQRLVIFEQKEEIRKLNLKSKPFNFLTPYLTFAFKPSKSDNYRFSYTNEINPPSLSQIQPIITNLMPIIQLQGNPNLKNEVNHNFNLSGQIHRAFSNLYIYTDVSFNFQQNAIEQSLLLNENGTGVSSFANTKGNNNLNYNLYVYKNFNKLPISLNIGVNGGHSNSVSILNTKENKGTNNSLNISSGVDLNLEQFYFGVNHSFNTNNAKYSLNENVNNKFQNQQWRFYFEYNNPKLFKFEATWDYTIMPKNTNFNQSTNTSLCNVAISKIFTKRKQLTAEIGVFDLFNGNKGYTRAAYGSVIQDARFNTFTQFFYGKLTWKFNRSDGKAKKNEDED